MRRATILVLGALLAGALGAGSAAAQSALSTRGLGFPIEPQDARSRGLGGVGLGFTGGELSWFSPAGVAGLPAPGLVVSYQYDDFLATAGAGEFEGGTARFPMALAGFPVNERIALFAGFGSFLDQNWRIESSDTLLIGGEDVPIVNQFASQGGVVRLRAGGAYQVIPGVAVGLGVDAYTGSVTRTQGRIFPGEVVPACCRASWRYGGLGFTAGAHFAPTEATGIGVSVSYGGTLDATPTDSVGTPASYELPLVARVGATGRIAQNLLVAVGGSYDGWSALDEALASEGGAQDSWSANAGIEWDALSLQARPLPIRLGARTGTLPFRWRPELASEFATESALTAGAGIVLAGGAVRPDFAFEFGNRGGDLAGIDESFWRFAFSVRVLGR